jgi:KDO2-lipid IV(A) lauroyltransferase
MKEKGVLRLLLKPLYKFAYIITLLFVLFIEYLPVRVAYFLAKMAGLLLYVCSWRRRRQIRANLKIVYPDGPPFAVGPFMRAVFAHACYTIVELFLARRLLRADTWQNYITGPGVDVMREDKGKAHGGVLVCSHLGNFALSGYVPGYLGYPMYIVIHHLIDSDFTNLFATTVSGAGANQKVQVKVKKEAYEACVEALAEGRYVTLVADQYGGSKSLLVNFFGHPSYTVAGPASLARRFQIPYFHVGAFVRTGFFRFVLYTERVPVVITDNKQADLENMATAINRVLEKYILLSPEQWLTWLHRRWRD